MAECRRILRSADFVRYDPSDREQARIDLNHDRARLAELRAALAEWCRFGIAGIDWTVAPRAARYYGR